MVIGRLRYVGVVAALVPVDGAHVAVAAMQCHPYKPGQVINTTLAKAQKLVPFRIRIPAQIPKSLYLNGVAVGYPAVPNAPRAVEVTLEYANRDGYGVLILERLGHQPPGLKKLDGIPCSQQARPKNIPGAHNGLTLYFANLLCSLSSPMAMEQLKRIAVSMRRYVAKERVALSTEVSRTALHLAFSDRDALTPLVTRHSFPMRRAA